jgi:Fe2+ transport system protein FeoA
MSSVRLAFSSDGVTLSSLAEGAHGVIVGVRQVHGRDPVSESSVERLLSLGVTPGARVTMLQRFPGIVFLCDQTELAVERGVAHAVLVRPLENPS